jgi:ribosome-binding ATPase YchF (GTP1/OBG family)
MEPNIARVEVPYERFTSLWPDFRPRLEVPATLSVIDIVGLMRGAGTGEGLATHFSQKAKDIEWMQRVYDDIDKKMRGESPRRSFSSVEKFLPRRERGR